MKARDLLLAVLAAAVTQTGNMPSNLKLTSYVCMPSRYTTHAELLLIIQSSFIYTIA